MQVSFKRLYLLSAAIIINYTSFADVIENFNSRKGGSIHSVRATLQSSCWSFHHFDVNTNGWNPKLEGDGAMVADINSLQYSNSGIYTPVLQISSQLKVSFEYTFNKDFDAASTRSLKICLANSSNEVVRTLETINIIGINATKRRKYATVFNLEGGEYRLILLYSGKGGDAMIAIDEFNTSAPYKYIGGCSASPVALRDIVTGNTDRTASGSLIGRDVNATGPLTAYLLKNSPDGDVALSEDGSFTFKPNKNFTGNATKFVYKVCNSSDLCSADATVVINFPPASFTNLSSSYKYDGNIEISWKTSGDGNIRNFELERSVEGGEWLTAGSVAARNKTTAYRFLDNLSKNKVLKNDIYYRIKEINADGAAAASKLLVVRVFNSAVVSMISVTPNLAKSDIAVSVQLQESSVIAMRVINDSGITVLHQTAQASPGATSILVDGSSKLQPGIYSLEVAVNSKDRMVVKLLKE